MLSWEKTAYQSLCSLHHVASMFSCFLPPLPTAHRASDLLGSPLRRPRTASARRRAARRAALAVGKLSKKKCRQPAGGKILMMHGPVYENLEHIERQKNKQIQN